MFAGSSSFQIGKLFMDDASQKEMVAMLAEGVTQEFSSDDIEYALFSIASGNSYNAEVLIMQIAMENKSQPAELIERFISKFGREPHLIDGRHIPPILSSIRETIAQEIEQYQNRVRSGFLEDSAKHGMTEAVKWLGIAADFDDLDAIVTLAKIYRGNDGIPKDDALSFNYFAKAAEMGDSDSMIEVGRRFENGVGIEENLNKAFEYYKLAAEKGNHYGQYNLGICYANGIGVSTDLSEAKRWMEEAQKNGNPGAKAALEQIHTQERIANGAILLTARELVIGYENNELAADGAVKGKIIEVSGIIVSVSQDILGQYYVALQGPRHSFRNVQCFFSQDKLEQLTRLNKGQTITISGRCDGLMMNHLARL